MKHMNMKKQFWSLNLQLFAEGDSDGDDAGGDDQEGDDNSDEDGDEEENEEDDKKFSQKDLEEAVKKRLAREKRKWQRQQSSKKPDIEEKAGDETKKSAKDAESKAIKLEVKVACYEADVAKESVEDVAALARAYMEADEDLDLEEAIEKVVKKYPHFKKPAADPYEETGKSWGQRQSGKGMKKMTGVEQKFYELNPDLKK